MLRAVQSQLIVDAMKSKCENMKGKLDFSKITLKEAQIRAETRDKVIAFAHFSTLYLRAKLK